MQPIFILRKLGYLVMILVLIIGASCTNTNNKIKMKPPIAEKISKELTIHGHTRIDNYYWLNERENPKVIEYLKAENEYKEEILKHTESFQKDLFDEIVGRIKLDDESVPYKENGYYYYRRYEEDGEYPVYCRKKETLDAEEEIMFNVNEMAKGYEYYHLGGVNVSPDNKIAAFAIDTVGRRKYTIYFKNLETGGLYQDKIEIVTGGSCWANDNKTLFFTRKNEVTLRSEKIFKHTLGTDVSKDEEIYYEEDETFDAFVYKTKSKKYIVIGSAQTLSNEYRVLDADNPSGEFKVIQPRERNLEYSIDHFKDKFYIKTNYKAKNFRLMETSLDNTSKENWKEVIPHREDVMLEGIEIFEKYLTVSERKNGLTQLRIINWEDGTEHYLDFGEEAYTAWVGANPEFDTEVLRYGYSSLTTPFSTIDYDMASKTKTIMKEEEVLGDFDKINYEAKRLYAEADDGTKVPISLVYRKGIKLDGNNPTLIYGYGSYGATIDPYFNSSHLSLLNRGFVYAIAHVRGSELMGRQWYEDGKLLKKKNTFTDFNDCAEFLIEQKYTNPEKLFAEGGSAGGLLMGAITNMQPELYKGIICAVPFVDVVTTMLDEDIPLTTGEYDEWGNPNEKEYYEYMLSYSPYDNIEAKDYPNILVTTGLHDSQVQYWEPAKYVAKLRNMKTDGNIILLHTNMEAGHGGASGRFKRYKETAMEYAFLFNLLGITE